jgi:hypothetical protein
VGLPETGASILDEGADPLRVGVACASWRRRAGSRHARLGLATVISFLPWSRPRGVAAPPGLFSCGP